MRAGLRLTVLMLVAVIGTRAAHAEDPPIQKPKASAALDHLARANKLYNVRSFEDAATEYKAGALVEPAPIFDYNLGQCYRQLGKFRDAIWHYQRFLKASPETSEHDVSVRHFIAMMQAELDKPAATEPPTEAATTPPPSTSSPAQTPVAAARLPAPVVPLRASDDVPPWYKDGLGWGLTVTGVVAIGVAGGLFLDASNLNDDANHAASQRESKDLHDKASTRSLVGTVIGIGGVGLSVTGVIKLAIHPQRSDRPVTGLRLGVSPGGFTVSGRF